jgi:hypothetical protein
MNHDDVKEPLKRLEVFADGRSVYEWEPVAVGDIPRVIVVSKTNLLLWGHEILQAISNSRTAALIEKITGADKVIAEWANGTVEVMTDDETKFFTSGEGWQEYWNSLDEWPKEIGDEEGNRSK